MGAIFQKPPYNYQYYVGVSNLVNYRFDAVQQTAPVTNGALHNNIVIPARTIVQSGQILDVKAFGNMGAHGATSVTVEALLNGSVVFTGTSAANGTPHAWEMWIRFFTLDKAAGQSLMNATYITNIANAVATGVIVSSLGAQNTLNPFGGAGFGFDVDNVLSFRTTDAGGAENINQFGTYVSVQERKMICVD